MQANGIYLMQVKLLTRLSQKLVDKGKMKQKFSLIMLTFLIWNVLMAHGLEISGVEEGPCEIPKPAEDIDFTWIQFIPKWYFTGGNSYDIYRTAAGFSDFEDLTESELFYEYCPYGKVNKNGTRYETYGFGGELLGTYTWSLGDAGVYDLFPQAPLPDAGETVKVVATLTDNKTFVFSYKCWVGLNQRGWRLATTSPVVSVKVQKEIEEHAASLRFDRDQFQFLRYELCSKHY